ncbi:hypothetical protein [Motilimonas eburnea]|uniref:hypothetical protein n=1 Tax=Motilimonas eburnea TaxID=1737488 RepID=UPI001E4C2193|nr:hypothetical protein [Motilimonas eburnea]MCE2573834.1 hypothetical protein [Motilimonas eburnea]
MNYLKLIPVISVLVISACSSTPEKKVEDFIDVDVCQLDELKQESGVVFADLSGEWSNREYYDKDNNTCVRQDTALAEAQLKLYQYNTNNKESEQ